MTSINYLLKPLATFENCMKEYMYGTNVEIVKKQGWKAVGVGGGHQNPNCLP